MLKSLTAMQETQIWLLGRENLLEKEMATYSYILVWKIPWIKEPVELQFMGSQTVGYDWVTNTFTLNLISSVDFNPPHQKKKKKEKKISNTQEPNISWYVFRERKRLLCHTTADKYLSSDVRYILDALGK